MLKPKVQPTHFHIFIFLELKVRRHTAVALSKSALYAFGRLAVPAIKCIGGLPPESDRGRFKPARPSWPCPEKKSRISGWNHPILILGFLAGG